MTNVVKQQDAHIGLLMGLAFERIRLAFDGPAWSGLRQSHLRVVESLGADGARASDVARRLRMTKQGAGQLVATLLRRGLVVQVPDPADRRARLLVLTESGFVLWRAVQVQLDALESEWAGEVGAADYATFRGVLERLAAGPADA